MDPPDPERVRVLLVIVVYSVLPAEPRPVSLPDPPPALPLPRE